MPLCCFLTCSNATVLLSNLFQCDQITSLQGVEELKQLVVLNVASTRITTDTLLYLVDHPSLTQLSFTNTDNIVGDTALQYLAGRCLVLASAACAPVSNPLAWGFSQLESDLWRSCALPYHVCMYSAADAPCFPFCAFFVLRSSSVS